MTEPLPGLHSAGIFVRAYGSWLCASLSGLRLDLSPECSLPGLPPLAVFGLSSSFPPHSDGLLVGLLDDKYLVLYLKMWAPGQGKGIENIAACS